MKRLLIIIALFVTGGYGRGVHNGRKIAAEDDLQQLLGTKVIATDTFKDKQGVVHTIHYIAPNKKPTPPPQQQQHQQHQPSTVPAPLLRSNVQNEGNHINRVQNINVNNAYLLETPEVADARLQHLQIFEMERALHAILKQQQRNNNNDDEVRRIRPVEIKNASPAFPPPSQPPQRRLPIPVSQPILRIPKVPTPTLPPLAEIPKPAPIAPAVIVPSRREPTPLRPVERPREFLAALKNEEPTEKPVYSTTPRLKYQLLHLRQQEEGEESVESETPQSHHQQQHHQQHHQQQQRVLQSPLRENLPDRIPPPPPHSIPQQFIFENVGLLPHYIFN